MSGSVDNDKVVSFSSAPVSVATASAPFPATLAAPGEVARAVVPPPSSRLRSPDPASVAFGVGPVTVLAITTDESTSELFSKVVVRDRLYMTADVTEALALAVANPPDAAFVEIASGAGLAMVHHLKAIVPSVTIFALATREGLDAAANSVALGGTGLLILPLGGDEILSSIESVKIRLRERAFCVELEQTARLASRSAGWMGRLTELADCPSRAVAAELLGAVLAEATSAEGAAIYPAAAARPAELTRVVAAADVDDAPAFVVDSDVLDYARRARLLVVPLATRTFKVGLALLATAGAPPPSRLDDGPPRSMRSTDGVVKLLATQGATALALLAERERAASAPVKDPGSSAYSFAYYADVAGREIDKARRYGRRFAIATIAFDAIDEASGAAAMRPPEIADQLLLCARDIDVLARVDEQELHLLMPECDGLLARACRRRILARFAERGPRGLLVGVATFPHDGRDLSQLLRAARRRAEGMRGSIVHRLGEGTTHLVDLLATLEREGSPPAPEDLVAPRPITLPLADVIALATSVTADALRGGGALITVAHHGGLSLGAAVRAALTPAQPNVTFHALDVRAAGGEDVEALSIIAEHGTYSLIGRVDRDEGIFKGVHAADPLLADALADRLGRAAGLRIFAQGNG